ncbi:MAG TPA: hypothetical protein VF475_09595 [Sphingobium sp.]
MTLTERAAQAMHASAQPEWPWDDPDCEPLRKIYRDAARAMIASLREPTVEMRQAGAEIVRTVNPAETLDAFESDAANIWRIMVEVALAQQG